MGRDKKFSDYFFDSKHSTSHGSASFAGFWEQRKVLRKTNSGIYVANDLRLSPDDSFKHLALLAPTGMGKTTRYIQLQALGNWNKNSTLIFFDPSGEIWNASKHWLQRKQKFNVIKLDLTALDGLKYNPLSQVNNKSSARIVAQSLVNAVYADAQNDVFWTESSIAILTLVIQAVIAKIPIENQNLAFVNRIINKFNHSQEEVNSLMELALNEEDFEEYSSFLSNSIKVKQSIIATCKSALYIYSDDVLKTICNTNTFDFSELRHNRTALFLIQEEGRIPYYKGFWSLYFKQLFEYLMTASKGNDVYCFMDEFANFGKISGMESIISQIRKKRVHLSLLLQSHQQIFNIYGLQSGRIILDNCNSKLYYGGLSHDSAKIVSDSLGMMTESYSAKGFFKRNQPLQRISRSLMNPDEVRTMKDECLFISGNHKPIHLKKVKAFYQNRTLKRRAK